MGSSNAGALFPDLEGKCVFITGGGSGIGEYITRGFVRAGAKVCFVQRTDATSLCDELEATYNNRPHFFECDITDIATLKQSINQARDTFGPINILVNNAASDSRHTLCDIDQDGWDASMNVNLRPMFFTAQSIADDMRNAGGGSIINFSSISYLLGNAGYPVYVTAKSAIVGLTRALARELGPDNIRVNAVLPGWVMTQRQRDLWVTDYSLAKHLGKQCLKQELVPQDIVEPTLFLASQASRMITSQVLVVDGGTVMTG